jgi:hypothetical protein
MSFLAAGVMGAASIAGGVMKNKAAKKAAKAQRRMAAYNAKIQKMNARTKADSIDEGGRRLVKGQREQFAQARMSVGGRGGKAEGTDLSLLIDIVEAQQLDQLEVRRNSDNTIIGGANQAAMTKYSGELQAQSTEAAGRAALTSGIIGAVGAFAGGLGPKPTVPGGAPSGFTWQQKRPTGYASLYLK